MYAGAILLANSENGTVQGAVATWRPRKSLPTRRQVATAPCTVPIRQQYPARRNLTVLRVRYVKLAACVRRGAQFKIRPRRKWPRRFSKHSKIYRDMDWRPESVVIRFRLFCVSKRD